MHILMVAPLTPGLATGNRVTAERWAEIFRELRHRVEMSDHVVDCDLLVALHAFRSYSLVADFRSRYPDRPVIIALTGTDLYRDLKTRPETMQALQLATAIVVLQKKAIEELPIELHSRVKVIFQSARPPSPAPEKNSPFQVCVLSHLRSEKDPLRTARAVRDLPGSSQIRVLHYGRALEQGLEIEAAQEDRENPRYKWVGSVPHPEALKVLASSHLLVITSLMEGGSNALCEALACHVPVIASRIPGLVGTLDEDYPGFFPVRDTQALRELLMQCETDAVFFSDLTRRVRALAPLIDPGRERKAWQNLLDSLKGS